jgi:hypothetical protein
LPTWSVLSLLWLALSACPSAGTQARPTVPVDNIPADVQADYEVFATNCSKCHALARALNAPVTDVKHWDLYVARMMRTAGSSISPEEAPRILRFLYWYTREHNAQGAQTAGEDMGGTTSAAPAEPEPAAEAPTAPAPEPSAQQANPYGQPSTDAQAQSATPETPPPSADAIKPEGEGTP